MTNTINLKYQDMPFLKHVILKQHSDQRLVYLRNIWQRELSYEVLTDVPRKLIRPE